MHTHIICILISHIYDYEQIVYEHIIIIIIISVAFVAIHLKTNRMLPQNV